MAWLGVKLWYFDTTTHVRSTVTSKTTAWAVMPVNNVVVLMAYEDRTYQTYIDGVLVTKNYVNRYYSENWCWRDSTPATWYDEYGEGTLVDIPVGAVPKTLVHVPAIDEEDFYWAYNESLVDDIWDDA